MKILFLTHNIAYHGGATFYRALHIAEGLAKRGHLVSLIASSPNYIWKNKYKQIDGLVLVQAPGLVPVRFRYGYDPVEAFWRCLWVSRQRFDLVHAFDSRPTVIYPALKAQHDGALLVLDWCDWFGRDGAVEERKNPMIKAILRPLETFYEEAFRHRADLTTVITQNLQLRAVSLGIPLEKINLLPNGSDIERIFAFEKNWARNSLKLPKGIPILGYMGSLFQADADLLTQTFRQVKLKYPNALLLIIGKSKANILETRDVIRTGYITREEINLYLCACDLLLIPQVDSTANRGRWPSKINDYIAVGRPTVVTDVGDVADLVKKKEIGLVTPANAVGLSSGIITMLENNRTIVQAGIKARKVAEEFFSWDKIVLDLESKYKSALYERVK